MTTATRESLTGLLVREGALHSPEWIRAFAEVPRADFLPRFHRRQDDGSLEYLDEEVDPNAWLQAVYSDNALATQRRNDVTTSSSTQPRVMAQMLEALSVRDGDRVLEVGTGTGYNTGLLCRRLGADLVTSVEVDAELSTQAAAALARLGYEPALVVGDGLAGAPDRAPFDRIIATCSANRVPLPWLGQCTDNGVIVASIGVAIVRLELREGVAEGWALPGMAGFVEARAADGPVRLSTAKALELAAGEPADECSTTVPVDLSDSHFLAWLRMSTPDLTWVQVRFDDEPNLTETVFADPTGSWVAARHPKGFIRWGGPVNLWMQVTAAYARWNLAGRPRPDRFGLTVDVATGRHTLWVDEPGHEAWVVA